MIPEAAFQRETDYAVLRRFLHDFTVPDRAIRGGIGPRTHVAGREGSEVLLARISVAISVGRNRVVRTALPGCDHHTAGLTSVLEGWVS
jgi:hypothetical protein